MTTSALELLPAKARRAIYVTYGLVVTASGAVQVGYSSVEGLAQPTWLTVTLAVVTFLAVPVSALAATNVVPVPRRAYVIADEINEEADGFSVGH